MLSVSASCGDSKSGAVINCNGFVNGLAKVVNESILNKAASGPPMIESAQTSDNSMVCAER